MKCEGKLETAEPVGDCPARVLIVAFDGAPSEALQQASTPHIDRLLRRGSYTWRAQTTLPTWSRQCFVSILDTSPTVAHLLGLEIPESWQGVVLRDALRGAPT